MTTTPTSRVAAPRRSVTMRGAAHPASTRRRTVTGRGHLDVAEHVELARRRNPDVEFWFDCHPRLRAAQARDDEALAQTLGSFGPDDTGALELAEQITGVTTNPNLIAEYDALPRHRFSPRTRRATSRNRRYRDHVRAAAATMTSLHARSRGRYGWVSAQVCPTKTFDAHAIVDEGLALAALGDNVMVKVPGSEEGYRAIRTLVAAGVSVNGTLSFGLPQFEAFGAAVADARETLTPAENSQVRTVVTHMAGRVGDAVRAFFPAGAPEELRLAEAALARQGSRLLAEIEPRSTILLSSIRTDAATSTGASPLAGECVHLSATVDRPVAYTIKPDTYVALQGLDLDTVFGPQEELRAAADAYVPGDDAAALRPLFDRALPASQFWTLPPFLQTLAEASSSHVKLIGGEYAA